MFEEKYFNDNLNVTNTVISLVISEIVLGGKVSVKKNINYKFSM